MENKESPSKGPASTKAKLIMVGVAVAVLAALLMARGNIFGHAGGDDEGQAVGCGPADDGQYSSTSSAIKGKKGGGIPNVPKRDDVPAEQKDDVDVSNAKIIVKPTLSVHPGSKNVTLYTELLLAALSPIIDNIKGLLANKQLPTGFSSSVEKAKCARYAQVPNGFGLNFDDCRPFMSGEITAEKKSDTDGKTYVQLNYKRFKARDTTFGGGLCLARQSDGKIRITTCGMHPAELNKRLVIAKRSLRSSVQSSLQIDMELKGKEVLITGEMMMNMKTEAGVFNTVVKLGGKINEPGFNDPLVLPLPPVCVCLAKGSLSFSSQVKIAKLTFTGGTGTQLEGKSIYTEEPIYVDVAGGMILNSNSPLACDSYTVSQFCDISATGKAYGETGTINVEFDIDKACKQYNISDQQCGQWKELFGEMVAEMQGCATSLSNATLEKEISAQWTQQLSNIPRACSFPLY